MYINRFGIALFLIITLAYGSVALFNPLIIARLLLVRFNKWDESLLPKIREARRIMRESPEEYSKKFGYQIIIIKMFGVIAYIMFAIGIVMLILFLFLD